MCDEPHGHEMMTPKATQSFVGKRTVTYRAKGLDGGALAEDHHSRDVESSRSVCLGVTVDAQIAAMTAHARACWAWDFVGSRSLFPSEWGRATSPETPARERRFRHVRRIARLRRQRHARVSGQLPRVRVAGVPTCTQNHAESRSQSHLSGRPCQSSKASEEVVVDIDVGFHVRELEGE